MWCLYQISEWRSYLECVVVFERICCADVDGDGEDDFFFDAAENQCYLSVFNSSIPLSLRGRIPGNQANCKLHASTQE